MSAFSWEVGKQHEGKQMTNDTKSNYEKLAAIDVSKHIEKKNNLSYLSWAWALDQLLRADPMANWAYNEPMTLPDGSMLVSCTVTAFGKPMTMHLPVMDYRNKAILNPNSFDVNTAMMRCLVKCIAVHGLGLYIYAGEDLPQKEAPNGKPSNNPTYKPEGDELIFVESVFDRVMANKGDPEVASIYLYEEAMLDADQFVWVWDKLGETKIQWMGKEYKLRGVLKGLHENRKAKEKGEQQ